MRAHALSFHFLDDHLDRMVQLLASFISNFLTDQLLQSEHQLASGHFATTAAIPSRLYAFRQKGRHFTTPRNTRHRLSFLMATASRDQLVDITSLIERVGSVFSLLGSFFIIVTFSCSSAFHKKPINRLVFYASFGNILCNVGTLMAGSFTRFPTSVGCQLQGALLQMYV